MSREHRCSPEGRTQFHPQTTAPPTSADSTPHTLRDLGLRHLRIKPNRPRTNGKAERFIQTLLNEWAYARSTAAQPNAPPHSPSTRPLQLRRPHGSLGHQPPAARLNNLVRNYS